ncbi:uncharacterized protein LOC126907273 isoform X2 [Daktulosphaira vitifoliae]|uniref:uncharacterized protein LOC126907273 isoform X2 n=1 Tax=Daktulosphaira vitifoliae TaxID=58002 RepID=UPI0021AA49C5|nr:uncharacterized protein LOC126907273 isoform X2 [Daktulosphaira vitifoliae]
MQVSIFIFIYFIHLWHVPALCPQSVKGRYLKYVITVIKHICVQKGWDSMKHLQLNQDKYGNMTIRDAFTQKIDKNNILGMFIIVVRLLNYKYTEILKNYVELITLSITECEKYSTDHLFGEFINCTQRIEHGVKNSMNMFDNLYHVMTFMSYIDIKFLFIHTLESPYVMVDEIYFAYHYINTMKISDRSFYTDQDGNLIPENAISVLLNIKIFLNELYLKAESVENKLCDFDQFPGRVYYHLIFKEKYLQYKLVNANVTTIDFVLIMLVSFFEDTIKYNYEDIGFKEILNPLLYKCVSLFVPHFIDPVSQEKGIVNLNILINEGNWNTLSYLYINHNGQDISLNRVLRDQANNNNFHLKKQYITQLLRCRFYDILKNVTTIFSGVIDLSQQEKNNSDKLENRKSYIECVSNFFLTMKSVQDLLNYLNTAMEKLKKASIWHENGAFYCMSPIKKIINNIFELMTEKNFLRDDFSDGILNLKEVANNYLADAQNVRFCIQSNLRNARRVHDKHCFYYEKILFSKQVVLDVSKKNANATNLTHSFTNPISNCQQACVELYIFCEDFISNEYKNLGFDKIN